MTAHQEDQLTTGDIIHRTIIEITEGITGIAASERRDWTRSIGYLLQRVRSGRFLETLKEEWEAYREKGRVKDDYMWTEQHRECFQEMLDFLDDDSPDQLRFSVLKKILLTAATETISSRESLLPQQYMKICRALSSGEAIVLLAAHGLVKRGTAPNHTRYGATEWLKAIADASTLDYPELVEIHERGLIEKNLVTERTLRDRSGIVMGEHFRLTDLGWGICQFIEAHDQQADG